uniref:glioma pathogenesis-related protein 1-like n=1 Tax=Styela clava TaxID=7725 RepID=UPI0019394773|nr:glioma pathogenesis-related protein 1-like [Styela clava]
MAIAVKNTSPTQVRSSGGVRHLQPKMRVYTCMFKFMCLQWVFVMFCGHHVSSSCPDAFLSSSNMFALKRPDRFKWESKNATTTNNVNVARSRRKRSLPNLEDSKLAVDAHNGHRATIGDEGEEPIPSNMLYMTWDPTLAITAMIYARKCIFEHSVESERSTSHFPGWNGENLWAGKGKFAGPYFNPAYGINSWFMEYKDWDFDTLFCEPGKLCGHYTQIVWAETYKVGCAWLNCSTFDTAMGEIWQDTAYMVCHYAPGGNTEGEKLYKVGPRCSECPVNDTCPDGRLCRNPIRDEILPAPSDGGLYNQIRSIFHKPVNGANLYILGFISKRNN